MVYPLYAHPGSLVHIFGGQKPSSSHARSCTPSFLRTLKQVLKSIWSSKIIWLFNTRLALTWECISFSSCLAPLLVIGPTISDIVSLGGGEELMLEVSSLGPQCPVTVWLASGAHYETLSFLYRAPVAPSDFPHSTGGHSAGGVSNLSRLRSIAELIHINSNFASFVNVPTSSSVHHHVYVY